MAKGFNSRNMRGMGGINMNNMVRQAQKMQADMERMQTELEQKTYSGKAGGGMVEAVVSGKKELTKITINPEAVDPEDVGMLEDLVLLAVNEALRLANEDANSSLGRLTGGLNLGGLGL
ncbi:MAG TPA: YbaB/EbfC family nucleoid-associated protein [Candidatus Onthomonas avicola]|nr:YbaB/EbfC family nucleoid-associated protein [Candidatus Onthomonas avicola]